MSIRALLRPKDDGDRRSKNREAPANDLSHGDHSNDLDSGSEDRFSPIELTDDVGLERELRHFCLKRFEYCLNELDSSSATDSDSSYVPLAVKKLMKQYRSQTSSEAHKKSKSRSRNRQRKLSVRRKEETPHKHPPKKPCNSVKSGGNAAKIAAGSRTRVPSKEEMNFQKSAASKTDGDASGSTRGSRNITLMPSEVRSKGRRSVVEILMDPTIDQKEAERMVVQMHQAAKERRVQEVEGYLDEVKNAIYKLDLDEGIDTDDPDYIDFSPDLVEPDDGEEDAGAGKMDAQAMRVMLTALAGREAKEDAVASVANVGASWRTVPHDQLNCCLSMDPKLLGDHRRRVKNNYDEFDKVFRPRKETDAKKDDTDEENEEEHNLREREIEKGRQKSRTAEGSAEKEEEPIDLAELTREQMLEIHDKIGPWVHHHTKKLDKFIQSKKYTPQYLLNHWNGELSDDDSEVDFEKHRSAWKKKLDERDNPGDSNQEGQPNAISPEDRVPTLQENNWFLFPTPLTRSYSTDTDEQGSDGQRTRPFSQLVMEGLVKHLKRQQEVEKSEKFLRENPWPPPSRYPPEVKPEAEIKYARSEIHDEEDEDNK